MIIADIKLTDDAKAILGPDIIFQETNVANWSALQSLIALSEEKFGDVPDVYVAGVGVFEPVLQTSFSIAMSCLILPSSHGRISGMILKRNPMLLCR